MLQPDAEFLVEAHTQPEYERRKIRKYRIQAVLTALFTIIFAAAGYLLFDLIGLLVVFILFLVLTTQSEWKQWFLFFKRSSYV